MRRLWLPGSLVLLSLCACDTQPAGAPPTDPAPPAPEPAVEAEVPEAPPAKQADLGPGPAQSINALGTDIYGQLRSEPGNLAISPASIHVALTMTQSGAVGPTADEMATVLHHGELAEGSDAGATMGQLLERWEKAEGLTLRTANRLFGESSYEFEKAYLAATKKAFGAGLEPTAFTSDPETSRGRINEWVAEQTERKILKLLPPGSIIPDTRLVLVNAVYFLADWATPFDDAMTSDADFAGSDGKQTVPMMHRTASMPYAELGEGDQKVQLVRLPYAGGGFGMTIVLPASKLDPIEAALDAETLKKWRSAPADRQVALSLPRFTVDPPNSVTLKKALVALGMKLPFTPNADFTKIADPPNPADRLMISDVFHKCFVKVDEKGTEAAAATAVVMGRAGSAAPPEPVVMNVDRPFLFLITDQSSGAVLFMGRVNDPWPPSAD